MLYCLEVFLLFPGELLRVLLLDRSSSDLGSSEGLRAQMEVVQAGRRAQDSQFIRETLRKNEMELLGATADGVLAGAALTKRP